MQLEKHEKRVSLLRLNAIRQNRDQGSKCVCFQERGIGKCFTGHFSNRPLFQKTFPSKKKKKMFKGYNWVQNHAKFLFKGEESYFSKLSSLVHFKNHHPKDANSKFQLKGSNCLDVPSYFVFRSCLYCTALESTRPKTNSAQPKSAQNQLGPKPSRPKTNSAQNQLGPKLIGPGLGDPSPLFFSFLFSFSSSSFFFFFHPLYYHWEFISLKGVSIQKIWKSGAL